MDPVKKIFIYSGACERRNLDAKKICDYLTKNNYQIVNEPNNVDYIIFFTCGFVKSVSDLCFATIEELKKYPAELIVAGCLPDIAQDQLKSVFTGKIITTKDLDQIDTLFNENEIKFNTVDDAHIMWYNYTKTTLLGTFKRIAKSSLFVRKCCHVVERTIISKIFGNNFHKTFPFNRLYPEQRKYAISISRGCIHNCSYCAIRRAVGPLKSKPMNACLKEFKLGLKQGYKQIVLEADDTGHYGIDIKKSLPELLDKMTKIDGDYTIELKNTHPFWIIKYVDQLEELLLKKKIKTILLSIQSGNNRILKLMRRSYTAEQLIPTLIRLKKAYPDLELGVHLMVGFPTETTEEFQDTLQLFEKLPLDFGSVFSFSTQDGTEADKFAPKIPVKEIKNRIRQTLHVLRNNNYSAWYSKEDKSISFYKNN